MTGKTESCTRLWLFRCNIQRGAVVKGKRRGGCSVIPQGGTGLGRIGIMGRMADNAYLPAGIPAFILKIMFGIRNLGKGSGRYEYHEQDQQQFFVF